MSRQTRLRIAHEAARIMVDDSVTNIMVAKKKAMERLSIRNKHLSPDNVEVESALYEYQQLFRSEQQAATLNEYRETALNAMIMLEPFSPGLAGSVLRGTVNKNDSVSLHVFTDTPEEIHFHLTDHKIPFEIDETRYQLSKKNSIVCPVCRFFAGEIEIILSIFPVNGLRQAPLSPIDEKPMKRVDAENVKDLISG
jgi:hypothetical protein